MIMYGNQNKYDRMSKELSQNFLGIHTLLLSALYGKKKKWNPYQTMFKHYDILTGASSLS